MASGTFFARKRTKILEELDQTNYTDKSPKGSVDAEILDLIQEINAFDGYVTTSSCAGRVAVFVEGHKASMSTKDEGAAEHIEEDGQSDADTNRVNGESGSRGAGPGGKGFGNRWLYVSHSPVPPLAGDDRFHGLFGIKDMKRSSSVVRVDKVGDVRLVKLSFSPLILHVLCASLQAAKPLLAAAINAGFRESGVQSLKALDDEDTGVMLAIRTAGLSFDTVVGIAETVVDTESGNTEDAFRSLVDEGYLKLCTTVINERFEWNTDRRERLRKEISQIKQRQQVESTWEDPEARRKRKKEEGQ